MAGPRLTTMAWRNLWRNRRRTLITLSGIVFGTTLAVLFTGLGDSTYGEMIDLAARMGGGHVTLQHPAYQETPSLKRTVGPVEALTELALSDPEVRRATPRINGQLLLAAAGQSFGAGFLAYDPKREDPSTLSLLEAIDEGAGFSGSWDKGIVLGAKLAENLGVKLGRKVVYTLTDKRGEIITGLARVRGIMHSGSHGVDLGLCLLPLDSVREALGYGPGEATRVAVFLRDQRAAGAVAARLARRVPPKTAALTWRQVQPELAGFIGMKVSGTLFFEFIIAILVAAGIFNTIFVSVMERSREFGIMIAIGFSPRQLGALVMWESLWVGLCGIALAALVTALPYHYLSTVGFDFTAMVAGEGSRDVAGVAIDPHIYVRIFPENALYIALAALGATLAAGIYPAWRAGRVEPVEAIKLV